MAKKLVHKTETVRRRVDLRRERWKEDYKTPHGNGSRHFIEVESAEFEGRIEVYLDIDKILSKYAGKAFQNVRKVSKYGPLEIRAVDLRERPDTRTVTDPKPKAVPSA